MDTQFNENSMNLEGMILKGKAEVMLLILTLIREVGKAPGLDKSLIAITTTVGRPM